MNTIHPVENSSNKNSNDKDETTQQNKDLAKNVDFLGNNGKKDSFSEKCKPRVGVFLDNMCVVGFMCIVTIWALFGDDIRQIATNKEGDEIFYQITTVALIFFTLEILLTVYGDPEYLWSFFFWLDLLSTLTLIFDIGWISDKIFGTGSSGGAKDAGQLARAARTSKIGSRAARIVRIIRLIRLIRIVKLYKATQKEDSADLAAQIEKEEREKKKRQKKANKVGIEDNNNLQNDDSNLDSSKKSDLQNSDYEDDDLYFEESELPLLKKRAQHEEEDVNENEMMQETNVGKKLSARTTKRVIQLVLSIMVCIPVYNPTTYSQPYTSYESGINNLYYLIRNHTSTSFAQTDCCTGAFNASWTDYVTTHEDTRIRQVYMKAAINDNNEEFIYKSYGSESDLDTQRTYEQKIITSSTEVLAGEFFLIAYFDVSLDANLNGWLGMGRTIFVCIVLASASMFFTQDANELVLTPIESMLNKVKRIARNPLSASRIEEEDAIATEALKKMDKKLQKQKQELDSFETSILEKTIVKIGSLLALGFGEAGSEIIAKNMQKSGEVDPMIKGKKVIGIFGYCDIRSFTDLTEVQQEGVMVFVNEIAEIIHSRVDYFSGAPNKNIGDAFQIVWKFPKDFIKEDEKTGELELLSSLEVNSICELSIIAFIKVQADLKKTNRLEKYRYNQQLIARLKLNEFRVGLGMGLHLGWAIEGAIGSEYKIDASYLSPNVNMASKLEDFTKAYGVSILISDSLVNYISNEAKSYQRMIDCMLFKDSVEPREIYTVDQVFDRLKQESKVPRIENLTGMEKKQWKINNRNKRDLFREKIQEGKRKSTDCFKKDADIKDMRYIFTNEFYQIWDQGIESYIQGKWGEAMRTFERTFNLLPDYEDKPSRNLMDFMESHNGCAPDDWRGYRVID